MRAQNVFLYSLVSLVTVVRLVTRGARMSLKPESQALLSAVEKRVDLLLRANSGSLRERKAIAMYRLDSNPVLDDESTVYDRHAIVGVCAVEAPVSTSADGAFDDLLDELEYLESRGQIDGY